MLIRDDVAGPLVAWTDHNSYESEMGASPPARGRGIPYPRRRLGENAAQRTNTTLDVSTMDAPAGRSKKYESSSPASQETTPNAAANTNMRFRL